MEEEEEAPRLIFGYYCMSAQGRGGERGGGLQGKGMNIDDRGREGEGLARKFSSVFSDAE